MTIQERVQKVSFKKIHYALMTDEDAETYGPIETMDMPISFGMAPNRSSAHLDAGDRVADTQSKLDSINITGELADLPTKVRADWFGHEISAEGGLIERTTDESPYIAIGLEGEDKLTWVYKIKLEPADDSYDTKKKGEAGYKTSTFTGEAIPLKDGLIRFPIRLSDPDVTETAETFFADVKKPTSTPTP